MARLERVSDCVMMVVARLYTLPQGCIRACNAQGLGSDEGAVASVCICLPPLKIVPTVLWLEFARRVVRRERERGHV